jgi:hypothetical protein
MAELPLFQQFQIQFTARLRNPQQPVPAGVNADRAEIYTELLFNNLRGFIDACCPISREITGELRWTELIRSFYIEYRCHSPLFRDIPREFAHWLRTQPVPLLQLPPFIADLAHYEWLELAADVHPAHVVRRGPVADVYGAPHSPSIQHCNLASTPGPCSRSAAPFSHSPRIPRPAVLRFIGMTAIRCDLPSSTRSARTCWACCRCNPALATCCSRSYPATPGFRSHNYTLLRPRCCNIGWQSN